MASISRDPNGTRRIQFFLGGNRKTIRLPNATAKQAESFKGKLESLIAGSKYGTIDEEVSRWLTSLDDATHAKLSDLGLTKPRNRAFPTVGKFLAEYFAQLNVKGGTLQAYGHSRRCLLAFFGESKLLRDIDAADADRYRAWLKTANVREKHQQLADATINKRVGMARMIFAKAVRWKLMPENPFGDMKAGSTANDARQFDVTRDMAQKVMDACPDAQWRLLFALSRFGGLRCPSEHLLLKWSDVDWEHNLITVTSPKTARYPGGESRVIPLFPEPRKPLMDVFTEAEPGTEYCITRYRLANSNLRTHLERILKRAGLKP